MTKIKIFECAICKKLFFNNIKGEVRFIGNRQDVREHLSKIHHINKHAGTPKHKGFRMRRGKDGMGNPIIIDERSAVTKNCILYKEF